MQLFRKINAVQPQAGLNLDPLSEIKGRWKNKVNLFKKPRNDEVTAVWTDVFLTLAFPVVLVAVVYYQAISALETNPFSHVSQLRSAASADLPYPPYGLSTPMTCRAPGGCLASGPLWPMPQVSGPLEFTVIANTAGQWVASSCLLWPTPFWPAHIDCFG